MRIDDFPLSLNSFPGVSRKENPGGRLDRFSILFIRLINLTPISTSTLLLPDFHKTKSKEERGDPVDSRQLSTTSLLPPSCRVTVDRGAQKLQKGETNYKMFKGGLWGRRYCALQTFLYMAD